MPPVCSNSPRRRSVTLMPKRWATPGRYQTGSMAIFVTRTSAVSVSTVPSGVSRPARIAWAISGMLMRARVTAMVGRMSQPAAIRSWNTWLVRWPHGSSETMRSRIAPLRKRADRFGRDGVGQVGTMVGRKLAGRNGKRAIQRIRPGMGADDIARLRVAEGGDHRTTLERFARRPNAAARRVRAAAGAR